MEVTTTKLFREKFSVEASYVKFIENFKNWIVNPDDPSNYYFGKNGGFRDPKLSKGYLMHVHTVPLSKIERNRWDQNFERKSTKLSDSYLIYIKKNNNYLIIDWIKKDAHNLTDYSSESKKRLDFYASIAEKFLSFEEIQEKLFNK